MRRNALHIRHSGFTLVELSVVLVIVGLLVGGVLAGKNLMRASELRSIMTDATTYQSAIEQFRSEYRYMPGDMPNATKYWPGTTNGNGNRVIEYNGQAGAASEAFMFWQHLALAGLIRGSYTGIAAANSNAGYIPGVNSPVTSIPTVTWGAAYINNSDGGASDIFKRDYRNWLTIGSMGGDNIFADTPFLKTDEAYEIDMKMDDGMPALGGVQIAYDGSGVHRRAMPVTPRQYRILVRRIN